MAAWDPSARGRPPGPIARCRHRRCSWARRWRGVRPIPLGKKNSLFVGSDSGGERWAVLASLINTAKLRNIDPQTYLADVLDRIVSGRTKVNALRELLPWEWKAAREPAAA
jgi:transposase